MLNSSTAVETAALALAFLWVGPLCGSEPSCPTVETMKPEQQLNYLRGERASLPRECIEVAIKRLGEARYAPAADVLAAYLDFKCRRQ
jgi:hypothetical protein